MAIHKVTLLGADGHLGPFILDALVTANFNVTVLKRKSSKSSSRYPISVTVVKLPDDLPENELQDAFTGQDAVIITTPSSLLDLHKRIARAAASAGVQRLIPADFGSVDSNSKAACDLVPIL
jgi:putative NADH-flavin reductase